MWFQFLAVFVWPNRYLRISVRKLGFTPRNLNLDGDKKTFPELGTVFKAAHVKMILWFLTVKAVEFAEQIGVAWLYKNRIPNPYKLEPYNYSGVTPKKKFSL